MDKTCINKTPKEPHLNSPTNPPHSQLDPMDRAGDKGSRKESLLFADRHLGPRSQGLIDMLEALKLTSLENVQEKIIPSPILSREKFHLPPPLSEGEALEALGEMMEKNKVYTSFIGMGFHDTYTPPPIQRHVLENPNWYTAYTPYQPEISQGRLEALLNFQTLIQDLTGMEISNASLLDEGSAAAEALVMAYNLSPSTSTPVSNSPSSSSGSSAHSHLAPPPSNPPTFVASPHLHPQVLRVLETRAQALGFRMVMEGGAEREDGSLVPPSVPPPFAHIIGYPDTRGWLLHPQEGHRLAQKLHAQGTLLIVDADPLALTLFSPPGEWGADIVIGTAQRLGIPLGNGGPHPAFLATRDQFKRQMPGRLVGVSVDSRGKSALRLALQTREQHIRREKATSNICTSQVLLANMVSMFAVYHGPEGLRSIAEKIRSLTWSLKVQLERLAPRSSGDSHPLYEVVLHPGQDLFDTLLIKIKSKWLKKIQDRSQIVGHNYRYDYEYHCDKDSHHTNNGGEKNQFIGISLNETTTLKHLQEIQWVFSLTSDPISTPTPGIQGKSLALESILTRPSTPIPQFPTDSSLPETSTSTPPPAGKRKTSFLTHPTFHSYRSETDLMRYIQKLQDRDLTLTRSMIPLGSCTMKLNATAELIPLSWPKVHRIHPFAPASQREGFTQMVNDLEKKLCELTGFSSIFFQPNAGSQGEYAGLLTIRHFLEHRNLKSGSHQDSNQIQTQKQTLRNVCLIPTSAHGTNPASAALAGFRIVDILCDEKGNVNIEDLQEKASRHQENLAAFMITYPSTHGVFEESIRTMCEIVHKYGGQVYMDGANLNALVGVCRPRDLGVDVSHMNLHKTFAIPHGGGGPGVGPIGVAEHLTPFVPQWIASAPLGSASLLTIPWMYISMMGAEGLRRATLTAILSANYIAQKLESDYPILYRGEAGWVAHECILDLRPIKKKTGIDVNDVAKRLMDYGFHAPTMSFPVPGTLMVEPTESESKEELDRFIAAMKSIREEIRQIENLTPLDKGPEESKSGSQKRDGDSPLKGAPHTLQEVTATEWNHQYTREEAAFPLPWLHESGQKYWPSVGRVDNAHGDRHLICHCQHPNTNPS